LGSKNPMAGKIPWNKSKKMSVEFCQKISESQKGRVSNRKGVRLTKEQKEKIGKANKGKISWMKGKNHSNETKEKMRLAKLNKPGNRSKIYHCNLLSPKNILHTKIINLTLFAMENNINKSNLHLLLNRKRKSCQGWRLVS